MSQTKTLGILYRYTAERRDVLENTSSEAREIFRGVQKIRSRENLSPEGDVFPNESQLEAVYGHSLIIIRPAM